VDWHQNALFLYRHMHFRMNSVNSPHTGHSMIVTQMHNPRRDTSTCKGTPNVCIVPEPAAGGTNIAVEATALFLETKKHDVNVLKVLAQKQVHTSWLHHPNVMYLTVS